MASQLRPSGLESVLPPVDLLFLAFSLAVGGAERQLVNLAIGLHRRGYRVAVAVLRRREGFEAELRIAGVPIFDLQRASRVWSPLIFVRLVRIIRRLRPINLYTFLGFANVLGAILRPVCGNARVIWGVRASFVDYRGASLMFRLSDWLERVLAIVPDLIICNSHVGKHLAEKKGYPAQRLVVIPNGIDTARFMRRESCDRIRREWGIKDDERVVGLVGRIDPMKDHATFLRAAANLSKKIPNIRFVCVGGGTPQLVAQLRQLSVRLSISDRIIWTGERSDMPDVYSAIDILCLSSRGEGFPNVIGEAMACGTPCIATNVGDVARILDGYGVVVEARDPEALASGLESMLKGHVPTNAQRKVWRSHILELYSVEAMCHRIEGVLRLAPVLQNANPREEMSEAEQLIQDIKIRRE